MYIPQRVYKTQDTMYDYSGTIALIPASKKQYKKFNNPIHNYIRIVEIE